MAKDIIEPHRGSSTASYTRDLWFLLFRGIMVKVTSLRSNLEMLDEASHDRIPCFNIRKKPGFVLRIRVVVPSSGAFLEQSK